MRVIQRSTCSGRNFPSSVGQVSSLKPPMRSGAPASSTFRWALSAQMTPSHALSIERRPTMFAAVPLKTGKMSRVPKTSSARTRRRSVQSSAP